MGNAKTILAAVATCLLLGTTATLQAQSLSPALKWGTTKAGVRTISFSPAGEPRVATSSPALVVRNANNGAFERQVPQFSAGAPQLVARFSPNGTRLAVGEGVFQGVAMIRVFDTNSWQPVLVIPAHNFNIRDLAFSSDGTLLVSCDDNPTEPIIRLWSMTTGTQVQTFSGHEGLVRKVDISPDNQTVLSASFDQTVRTWLVATGAQMISVAETPPSNMHSARFAPDGLSFVTGSANGRVSRWETDSGTKLMGTISEPTWVLSVDMNPSGTRIIAGQGFSEFSGLIREFDANTGDYTRTIPLNFTVNEAEYTPDGTRFGAVQGSGRLRVYDQATGDLIYTEIGPAFETPATSVAYSPDGTRVAATSQGGVLRVFDSEDGSVVLNVLSGVNLNDVTFNAAGTRLLAGGINGQIRLYDFPTGTLLGAFAIVGGDIYKVAFRSDGQLIVASSDRRIRVIDASNGLELVSSFPLGTFGRITDLKMSPSGLQIGVTTSCPLTGQNLAIRVVDPTTMGVSVQSPNVTSCIWSLTWSPDGSEIWAGGENGFVVRMNAFSGNLDLSFTTSVGVVENIAISPDGRRLLVAGFIPGNSGMGFYRTTDGFELVRYFQWDYPVAGLEFAPDGETYAFGRSDGTVSVALNPFVPDLGDKIFWQNEANGSVVRWSVPDAVVDSSVFIGTPPNTNWVVVGGADMNNDGVGDLIWQNITTGLVVYWLLDSAGAVQGVVTVDQPAVNEWATIGFGDLNNDGYNDILWQNVNTGLLAIWYMDGLGSPNATAVLGFPPDNQWRVAGIADLNGDSNQDILWYRQDVGLLYYWAMDGSGEILASILVGVAPSSDWNVVGISDLFSDGAPDILWVNEATGQLAYWSFDLDGNIVSTGLVTGYSPASVAGWVARSTAR
ncbi:MAG: FG-GAP-like repeat-containing protein [Fimbriimonadaceae bacterium]